MSPPVSVAMTIARGTERLGSFASSDSVETASKPRKDRQRIAAPAMTAPNPSTVPSPVNGAARSTEPEPEMVAKERTAKVRMKIPWAAMMTMFARATETMPMMLRIVTRTMATRTKTHEGTIGRAALR